MSKQQELTERLTRQFSPLFLQIENESHMHSSDRGGESHFKVVIVTDEFEGKPKVVRHRMIYQFLAQDLENGIHALALHTYTPKEWQSLGKIIPKSTNCLDAE
ncbi:BolA family protein [Basfia succiniciproducens]|uniref:Transcriptional regulator, BolA protein family n=1 Tax=Basfia succiniciproducens TaxID=653940 RepID=A0A1G5AUF2_9PAST|nr:BolA family protein [Basfia succiniciproducens]QIM69701.1 transcriptional regulator [Basfia succiniciproducens]SCX81496.1 transcriptional regulator, BolA protein family [Basfia succiniciproducens]